MSPEVKSVKYRKFRHQSRILGQNVQPSVHRDKASKMRPALQKLVVWQPYSSIRITLQSMLSPEQPKWGAQAESGGALK